MIKSLFYLVRKVNTTQGTNEVKQNKKPIIVNSGGFLKRHFKK